MVFGYEDEGLRYLAESNGSLLIHLRSALSLFLKYLYEPQVSDCE